jgi:hypothetical protein
MCGGDDSSDDGCDGDIDVCDVDGGDDGSNVGGNGSDLT